MIQPHASGFGRWLIGMRPKEWSAFVWAFVYFFTVLCAYYIIRPVRDTMAIVSGVDQIQWLFTGTFVAMLAAIPVFGWLTSRWPRRRFLPAVYLFFIANLIVFAFVFWSEGIPVWAARAFYIWAGVFALFAVSVFWSFMADLFDPAQAKRLFGPIAAGGTLGAICGPAITAALASRVGHGALVLFSAGFLCLSVVCIGRLSAWSERHGSAQFQVSRQALGGSIWAGISLVFRNRVLAGIALLIVLYTTLATFLYFEQARLVEAAFANPSEQTGLFARIDLMVNLLALVVQVWLTSRIARNFGLTVLLAIVPVIIITGFSLLAAAPSLAVLIAFQVMRRAGNFALFKPAREMLYTTLDRESRYKGKNFVDTVVYRGGDVASGWLYLGLSGLGLSLAGIAVVALPFAFALLWAAVRIGRQAEKAPSVRAEMVDA